MPVVAFAVAMSVGFCYPAAGQKVDKPSEKTQQVLYPELPEWLSLDGELRGRTEAETARNYKAGNTQTYELTRVRGGIRVSTPKFFSTYAQFQDTHALNLPLTYTASNMRDAFDLRQAYLQFEAHRITAFAGRQPLRFGDERLIGISNWTNNSRTFDVIHARLGSAANRLDLFSGSVVKAEPTSFDRPTGGFDLHGAYATLTTLVPSVRLESFVLLKTSPATSQQGLKGREVLVAPGIRAAGHTAFGFDYDVQGTIERGSYVNDAVHAGSGYLKGGYAAPSLPWAPHLQLEYDYATGNAHRDPLRVSTFDQFYPSNHNVFGLTDMFGWQNIKQRRLNLDMQPNENWKVLVQGESLHAATTHDSVYAGAGTVLAAPPLRGFPSDGIGTEVDASGVYASRYHILFEIGAGHFFPGALMTSAAHGAQQTLAYLQLTYDIQWSRKPATDSGP